ncbi:calcium-binding protein 2-like [Folsomia candida]|uniref:calcium-binding protein 2-like n=1 Tax=Folsomia candida TaxID=158441 RepID=UPI000B90926D|nr:calcium-binding protein 2-like [Folsomia candida]
MGKSHILEKPFTPEELEKFKGILQSLPSYKDGTIHNSEYIIFCNAAGIPTTPEQAEAYKNYFRVPYGDELARVSDIIKVFESLHDIQAYCLTVAKHFDKNGDGLISADEYEAGVAAMKAFDPGLFGEKGKFKFDELIKKADTNKDGKLQVEELAAWFSTM